MAVRNDSIPTDRMADREWVLWFRTFHIHQRGIYPAHELDGYMNQTMKKIDMVDMAERGRILVKFDEAMTVTNTIFVRFAFSRSYQRPPTNTAV